MTTPRRKALVLGSSSGIGLAAAIAMADEGWATTICGHSKDRLDAAADHKAFRHRPNHAVLADLDSAQGCIDVVESAAAAHGGLDALVVNNGGPPPGDFDDLDDDAWQRGFERTVQSSVRTVRAALPHLQQGHEPRIVFITSISTSRPLPRLLLSNSLRMAVVGLMRHLSAELAPQGIAVNAIGPGYTGTERLNHLFDDLAAKRGTSPQQEQDAVLEDVPLGRLITVEEMAAAIVWLSSPGCGPLTGQEVVVDGGWRWHR